MKIKRCEKALKIMVREKSEKLMVGEWVEGWMGDGSRRQQTSKQASQTKPTAKPSKVVLPSNVP